MKKKLTWSTLVQQKVTISTLCLELFPNVHWHLYDSRKIIVRPDDRVSNNQRLFSEQDVSHWQRQQKAYDAGQTGSRPVLFVSDIRNLSMSGIENKSTDQDVRDFWLKRQQTPEVYSSDKFLMEDQELQKSWVEAIRPTYSMLKFRTPFVSTDNYPYLAGDVMFQPWVGPSSSETRLIIAQPENDEPFPTKSYSVAKFSNQLFYHNQVTRERGTVYLNPVTQDNTAIDSPEFNSYWDETAELFIWRFVLPNESFDQLRQRMSSTTNFLSWYAKFQRVLKDNTEAYNYQSNKTIIQRRADQWSERIKYGTQTSNKYRSAFGLVNERQPRNTNVNLGTVSIGGTVTDSDVLAGLASLTKAKIPNFSLMTPLSFQQALQRSVTDNGALQYLTLAINTITSDSEMRQQWLNQLTHSISPQKVGTRVIRQMSNLALVADTDDLTIKRQAWLGLSILNGYRQSWPNFQYTLGSFPCAVGTANVDPTGKPVDICRGQENGWYLVLENAIQQGGPNTYNLGNFFRQSNNIQILQTAIIQVVLALWQAYQDHSFHHGNLTPASINIVSLPAHSHFVYHMGMDYLLSTQVAGQIADFSSAQVMYQDRRLVVKPGSKTDYDASTDVRHLFARLTNVTGLPQAMRIWVEKWASKLNAPGATYPNWVRQLLNEHPNIIKPYIVQPDGLAQMALAASSGTSSVVQPAPVSQPVVQPAPISQPVVQPAPVSQPVVQPAPVSQPAVQPAPVSQPVVQPAPVSQPVVQPAPVSQPVVQPAPISQPVVQPAPISQPVVQPTPVSQPVVQPVVQTCGGQRDTVET